MTGDATEEPTTRTPIRPEAVPTGTNVLVAGPGLTGKREIVLDMLGAAPDPEAMLVTTKHGTRDFRTGFDARYGDRRRLQFVDCVSRQRSMATARDTDEVRHVSGPGDLTGIGILASGQLYDWYRADERVRGALGIHSLSTLLMYANLRRVYQFMHVLAGRVDGADCVGAYALDTVASDTEPIDRFTQLCDAVVDTRQTDEGRELRVRGGEFGPRSWTAF
ncbi:DUF7504 family protein [Halobaculum lipolyticum]|uniref:Recombinase RecA n=1 Tax=Halobaculum lipolyticum TaxID=3032001 RepID=A0ABD5WDI9_9EURY|nr:hypothetical protein [Halobaculum sp. DT31]